MRTNFERFELTMTLAQAESCSQPGRDAEPDVLELMQDPKIRRQRKKISPDLVRQELEEYGAWSDEEPADDEANWMRLLWVGACDIVEECHSKRSNRA